jgi:DNA-binding response OmpR family regulator
MRILIAEDEPISRHALEAALVEWGHNVLVTCDGIEAWQALQSKDAPNLVILDWIMPGMSGVEVCQRVRETSSAQPAYIIMLTVRDQQEDIVAGLRAGADDYITKPFNRAELHARVQAGGRILELQTNLANRVRELEDALSQIKRLQGLLPICCYCKKIRDDQDYWQQVECYITEHSEVQFTHCICPECYEKIAESGFQKLNRAY